MKNTLPEVDSYIEKAAPFAQPILKRIRGAFHAAHPDVAETIKWGVPHFEYKGVLGSMAAFKAHVGWGFWKSSLLSDPAKLFKGESRGMGGARVESIDDLPSEAVLVDYVREAIRLNEEGVKVEKKKPAPRAEVETPEDLAKALKKAPAAKKAWDAFAPSHRREYVEWITEAKQEATRAKRLATTIEWLTEGKSRNWKYVKK
jgi:uncharacterized protein YdeI (YjbR/CyaY-like superfamily)